MWAATSPALGKPSSPGRPPTDVVTDPAVEGAGHLHVQTNVDHYGPAWTVRTGFYTSNIDLTLCHQNEGDKSIVHTNRRKAINRT
jgi:hypothetical protein